MPTSKERVRFILTSNMLHKQGMNVVLSRAFNITVLTAETYLSYDPVHADKILTIICRPSQFARFLIYRSEADISNSFKAIKPELFIPEEEKKSPLDVSTHEKRHNYETSYR